MYGPEVVNSDGSVTVYTEDKTQLTIDNESVLRLIDHWQRARFARQQIEEDLKVTAEEMKTAGMSEELAIIEAAIEKKQQKIIEAKDLFVRQAVELRQAYQAAPSAYTQLIENVLDTQRVRNDPSRTTLITSVDHVIREEAGTGGSFEKGISKTFDNSLTT